MNMTYEVTIYSILCFVTFCLAGIVALATWKYRRVVGGLPLALLMTAVAEWSLGATLEYAAVEIDHKIFWSVIEYIGALSSPVFLLLFAIEYNGLEHWLKKQSVIPLFIIPVITWGLAITNGWHHLIWTSFTPDPSGNNLIIYEHGVGFWIGVVGYSYLMLIAGITLLFVAHFRLPPRYRRQTRLALIGSAGPVVGNIVYITGISPLPGLDLTPLMLVFSGVFLALGIFREGLLDLIPLARNALIETMNEGMVVLDRQDRVVDINPAARKMLLLPDKDLIGREMSSLMPEWPAAQPDLVTDKQLPGITFPSGIVKGNLELSISPLRNQKNTPSGLLVLIHNIEHRKRAMAALHRRDAILRAVSLAAEKFLNPGPWVESVPIVLEQIGVAAELSRVYIFERMQDAEGHPVVSQIHEWAAPGISVQIDNPDLQNLRYREAGFERWDDAFLNHQAIYGLVRGFPASEKGILSSQDILSLAVMPIFVGEALWGFIGFDECRYERNWSESELEALRTAADIIGAALARNQIESAVQNRQRTLNLLHEILHSALQASDLHKMSQSLVDSLAVLIGADGCFLAIWDEKKRQATPLAAYGPFHETYMSISARPHEKTLTASTLKAGHPLVVPDVLQSPYISRRIARQFPARSILALPLIVGETKLGAILLSFNEEHVFDPDEIATGEQAAGLVALTLAKFQAVQHAYRLAEESETLRKAGAAVAATLNSNEAVDRVLEQLAIVVSYDSASVQLLKDGRLEIVGGRGWSDPAAVIGIRFPVPGDNPNSIVIQTRKSYILEEADKAYPQFNNPPHSHIRSWLGVPLIVRQQVIGLLAIDSSQPGRFTADQARMVSAFADHVAVALENARLFGEVQDLALTDPLTGLFNRRGLFELGHIEFARTRRFNRPFSAIMVDIDHFKRINDTFGHTIGGDPVLQALAHKCQSGVREIDLIGRYGGEEIIILLPETDLETATGIAERLRKAVETMQVQTKAGRLSITVSMGVAAYDGNTPNLEVLVTRADQAMYIAKHNGRNRVAISQ